MKLISRRVSSKVKFKVIWVFFTGLASNLEYVMAIVRQTSSRSSQDHLKVMGVFITGLTSNLKYEMAIASQTSSRSCQCRLGITFELSSN